MPEGDYTGLTFTVGVPFDQNHIDPTLAAAAAPTLAPMPPLAARVATPAILPTDVVASLAAIKAPLRTNCPRPMPAPRH